jgi:hypothetical protein
MSRLLCPSQVSATVLGDVGPSKAGCCLPRSGWVPSPPAAVTRSTFAATARRSPPDWSNLLLRPPPSLPVDAPVLQPPPLDETSNPAQAEIHLVYSFICDRSFIYRQSTAQFAFRLTSEHNEAGTQSRFTGPNFPQFFPHLRELAVKVCKSFGKPDWQCSTFGGPLSRESGDRLEGGRLPSAQRLDPTSSTVRKKRSPGLKA